VSCTKMWYNIYIIHKDIGILDYQQKIPIFALASRAPYEGRQPSSQKPRWQNDADCSIKKSMVL